MSDQMNLANKRAKEAEGAKGDGREPDKIERLQEEVNQVLRLLCVLDYCILP